MVERVLITGARAVAALDIARSLRTAGFEPHLADCSPAWLARVSNSAGPVHRYASPVEEPAAFARDIRALMARLDPVRIIPACEEVFHLAALAGADGFADRLFSPPFGQLATLHAKDRFIALCRELSLPVPDTTVVTEHATLIALTRPDADVVVKPVWSRFGARTLIAPTATELAGVAPGPDTPWLVQKRIIGEEVSFYATCQDGRITAFCTYSSDWRLSGGAGYAFRPLPSDQIAALRPMADALVAFAGTGQIACDAIIDAEGRPWLIECNPRATSGVHLFARSAAFGRALMGHGTVEATPGLRHLSTALWLHGLASAVHEGRLTAWRAQSRDGSDAVTATGDRLPALGALADAAVFGLRALRTGRPLTEAMTADIEWNGKAFAATGWNPPGR